MYSAFQRAKQAGKVSHLGLSTHQNAQRVLEAAVATGWYDLAMIAITPGGWYDWENKSILSGSPPMTDLQPLIARARESGSEVVRRPCSGTPRSGKDRHSPRLPLPDYDLRSKRIPHTRQLALVLLQEAP